VSGTIPQFNPASMQETIRKASAALQDALSRMARRQREDPNYWPRRERRSQIMLRQRINEERAKGELAVVALAAKAEAEVGLLPDCKTFDATLTIVETNVERDVRWCSTHHSEATHPRWCYIALGFTSDGSLR